MKRFTALFSIMATTFLLGVGCTTTNTTNTEPATSNENVNVSADGDVDVIDITSEEDVVDAVTEDVYGKDLTMVERYPDSIRSYYAASQYETDVSYQTIAEQEDIRKFYTDNLTAAGWTNSEEATDYMEYTKGDESNPEIITLYLTEYKTQGLVEYELVYEPALSDEELKSLEEENF